MSDLAYDILRRASQSPTQSTKVTEGEAKQLIDEFDDLIERNQQLSYMMAGVSTTDWMGWSR